MNKRGVGIKVRGEGWKIFQKSISGGGGDYSALESSRVDGSMYFV